MRRKQKHGIPSTSLILSTTNNKSTLGHSKLPGVLLYNSRGQNKTGLCIKWILHCVVPTSAAREWVVLFFSSPILQSITLV